MRDIEHLFFSTEGRISRKIWWLSQIGVWVASLITLWMYKTLGFHDAVFGGIVTIVVFVIRIFINVKRFRDRGKSRPYLCVLLGEIPIIGWIWGLAQLGFLPSKEVEDETSKEPTSLDSS